MSRDNSRYLQCAVSFYLVRGPDILPYRKRISRLATSIEEAGKRFKETFADEILEYEELRKRLDVAVKPSEELQDRLEELTDLWQEDIFQATEQQKALSHLVDHVDNIQGHFLSLLDVDDLIDSDFPLEELLKDLVDASYILWPDKSHELLKKMDDTKLHLFPSLYSLRLLVQRSAEEHHPIKILFDIDPS